MRTIGALPKSVLMLEIIGMVLLSLALRLPHFTRTAWQSVSLRGDDISGGCF